MNVLYTVIRKETVLYRFLSCIVYENSRWVMYTVFCYIVFGFSPEVDFKF